MHVKPRNLKTADGKFTLANLGALLESGAESSNTMRAAVALLLATSCDLVDAYDKGRIEVNSRPGPGSEHTQVAFVTNWTTMSWGMRGSDEALVELSAGLAGGLGATMGKLTPEHAGAAARAVLDAAGVSPWLRVETTTEGFEAAVHLREQP